MLSVVDVEANYLGEYLYCDGLVNMIEVFRNFHIGFQRWISVEDYYVFMMNYGFTETKV